MRETHPALWQHSNNLFRIYAFFYFFFINPVQYRRITASMLVSRGAHFVYNATQFYCFSPHRIFAYSQQRGTLLRLQQAFDTLSFTRNMVYQRRRSRLIASQFLVKAQPRFSFRFKNWSADDATLALLDKRAVSAVDSESRSVENYVFLQKFLLRQTQSIRLYKQCTQGFKQLAPSYAYLQKTSGDALRMLLVKVRQLSPFGARLLPLIKTNSQNLFQTMFRLGRLLHRTPASLPNFYFVRLSRRHFRFIRWFFTAVQPIMRSAQRHLLLANQIVDNQSASWVAFGVSMLSSVARDQLQQNIEFFFKNKISGGYLRTAALAKQQQARFFSRYIPRHLYIFPRKSRRYLRSFRALGYNATVMIWRKIRPFIYVTLRRRRVYLHNRTFNFNKMQVSYFQRVGFISAYSVVAQGSYFWQQRLCHKKSMLLRWRLQQPRILALTHFSGIANLVIRSGVLLEYFLGLSHSRHINSISPLFSNKNSGTTFVKNKHALQMAVGLCGALVSNTLFHFIYLSSNFFFKSFAFANTQLLRSQRQYHSYHMRIVLYKSPVSFVIRKLMQLATIYGPFVQRIGIRPVHAKQRVSPDVSVFDADSKRVIGSALRKIQFVPGWPVVFRQLRRQFRVTHGLDHLSTQFKFTRYMAKLTRQHQLQVVCCYELAFSHVLLRCKFFFNLAWSIFFIRRGLVYVNGRVCTQPFFQIQAGDAIQLCISFELSIYLLKASQQFIGQLRRVARLFGSRTGANFHRNVAKTLTSTRRAPRQLWWLQRQMKQWSYASFTDLFSFFVDIPSFFEVDFFTLSAMCLYRPTQLHEFNRIFVFYSIYGFGKMLNWKYIT